MHPYIHELADREGLLIWSGDPALPVPRRHHTRARGCAGTSRPTRATRPYSIWSIANELSSEPGAAQGRYIRRVRRSGRPAHSTRRALVGLAVAGYPGVARQRRYGPLDVGVNDYFGWYPGPRGSLFDRGKLSQYLDALRRCYPHDAILVTEFGAEANRDGSVEDKGTYAFQQDSSTITSACSRPSRG